MNVSLEIRVIEKFFKKEKQNRYIAFVSSKKNRKKFIQELSHLNDLQWSLFQELKSFDIQQIDLRLSKGNCYVISEDSSVDQSSIPLADIDKLIDSGKAFILVFGDAEQIYYEGEPPFNRYLSKRQ